MKAMKRVANERLVCLLKAAALPLSMAQDAFLDSKTLNRRKQERTEDNLKERCSAFVTHSRASSID